MKNQIKKLTSLALSLVLCTSALPMMAHAADVNTTETINANYSFDNGTIEGTSYTFGNNATGEAKGSVGGKAEDDMSMLISSALNTTSNAYDAAYLEHKGSAFSAVTELSMKVYLESNVSEVIFGTRYNNAIMSVKTADMKVGEWNDIKFVFNPATGGYSTAYLNDKFYISTTTKFTNNVCRLIFKASDTAQVSKIYIDDVVTKSFSGVTSSVTAATDKGIGEKADDDTVLKLSGADNTMTMNTVVKTASETVAKSLTFEVYPTSAFSKITVVGRGGGSNWYWNYGSGVELTAANFVLNQWNKVVVDLTDFATAKAYVNGVYVNSNKTNSVASNASTDAITARVGVHYADGTAEENQYTYIDNVQVLTEMPEVRSLRSDKYTIIGNKVWDLNGATVADILANTTNYGDSVSVVDANGADVTEAVETAITDDCQIIVKKGDAIIGQYYTKTAEYTDTLLSNVSFNNGTIDGTAYGALNTTSLAAVGGIGGKAEDDYALKIEGAMTDGAAIGTTSNHFEKGLTAISMKIYPVSGFNHMRVAKNGSGGFGLQVDMADMKPNTWNDVYVIYNPESGKNSAIYLNGDLCGTTTTKFITGTTERIARFVFGNESEVAENPVVYVDDITVKTVNVDEIMPLRSHFEKFDGISAGNATFATATGIGGKAADDTSIMLKANEGSSKANIDLGLTTVDLTGDVTISYELYPTSAGTAVRLRPTTGEQNVVEIPAFALDMNKWNSIRFVHYGATNANEIYINGKLYTTVKKALTTASGMFRLYTENADVAYFDNIQVVEGIYAPAAAPTGVKVVANDIIGYTGNGEDLTAQYDSAIMTDTRLYVNDGVYVSGRYTFADASIQLGLPTLARKTDTDTHASAARIYAADGKEYKFAVIVANYGTDGILKGVDYKVETVKDNAVTLMSDYIDTAKGDYIKAMVWDMTNGEMEPIADADELIYN